MAKFICVNFLCDKKFSGNKRHAVMSSKGVRRWDPVNRIPAPEDWNTDSSDISGQFAYKDATSKMWIVFTISFMADTEEECDRHLSQMRPRVAPKHVDSSPGQYSSTEVARRMEQTHSRMKKKSSKVREADALSYTNSLVRGMSTHKRRTPKQMAVPLQCSPHNDFNSQRKENNTAEQHFEVNLEPPSKRGRSLDPLSLFQLQRSLHSDHNRHSYPASSNSSKGDCNILKERNESWQSLSDVDSANLAFSFPDLTSQGLPSHAGPAMQEFSAFMEQFKIMQAELMILKMKERARHSHSLSRGPLETVSQSLPCEGVRFDVPEKETETYTGFPHENDECNGRLPVKVHSSEETEGLGGGQVKWRQADGLNIKKQAEALKKRKEEEEQEARRRREEEEQEARRRREEEEQEGERRREEEEQEAERRYEEQEVLRRYEEQEELRREEGEEASRRDEEMMVTRSIEQDQQMQRRGAVVGRMRDGNGQTQRGEDERMRVNSAGGEAFQHERMNEERNLRPMTPLHAQSHHAINSNGSTSQPVDQDQMHRLVNNLIRVIRNEAVAAPQTGVFPNIRVVPRNNPNHPGEVEVPELALEDASGALTPGTKLAALIRGVWGEEAHLQTLRAAPGLKVPRPHVVKGVRLLLNRLLREDHERLQLEGLEDISSSPTQFDDRKFRVLIGHKFSEIRSKHRQNHDDRAVEPDPAALAPQQEIMAQPAEQAGPALNVFNPEPNVDQNQPEEVGAADISAAEGEGEVPNVELVEAIHFDGESNVNIVQLVPTPQGGFEYMELLQMAVNQSDGQNMEGLNNNVDIDEVGSNSSRSSELVDVGNVEARAISPHSNEGAASLLCYEPTLPNHYIQCAVCLRHGVCNGEVDCGSNHRLCLKCARRLVRSRARQNRVCPWCRAPISTVDKVPLVGPGAKFYEED